MKRILLIAAPFGFGPSSKALILAEALRERHSLTLLSSGDAAAFLQSNAPAGVRVQEGRLSVLYPTPQALRSFDAFICISNMPAAERLVQLGLAARTIFFDSIAQWRAQAEPAPPLKGLAAHIVEDEFAEPGREPAPAPPGAVVTRPMVWPYARPAAMRRAGVLVHTGGMTSPAAGPERVDRIAHDVIVPLAAAAARHGHPVSLLGNPDVWSRLPPIEGVRAASSVGPGGAIQAIAQAGLLITTPGLGAVYEALSQATPILLLPPMNSTQVQHVRVLGANGIASVLGERNVRALSDRVTALPWPQQTAAVLQLVAGSAPGIVRGGEAVLARLLSAGPDALRTYSARMAALWSSLSHRSPQAEVLAALERLPAGNP